MDFLNATKFGLNSPKLVCWYSVINKIAEEKDDLQNPNIYQTYKKW